MIRPVPDIDTFLSISKSLGYKVFTSTKYPFNLNIVGWRNLEASPDTFEDYLSIYYKAHTWIERHYRITTRPGVPKLLNPVNPNGAAILVPDQYQGCYSIGTFKGYKALKQVSPVKVYRDSNLNGDWDMDPNTIESGQFGIHIHKAGVATKLVGNSSAGCQVFKYSADFDDFMSICNLAALHWGNLFTYTLLEF